MLIFSIQSFLGVNGADWLDHWIPLSMGAIFVAIILNATFLMIGKAFSIKEVEAFAKSEILQTAATAFMALFLITMIDGAFNISQQFIAGTVSCGSEAINIGQDEAKSTLDEAYDAIRCRLQSRAREIAALQGSVNDGAWADFTSLNLRISVFGIAAWQGDWSSNLYQKTEQKRIANNLATVLLIALNAQSAILKYMQANMLSIFIPLGILLRSFYFTRGIGALFISMGIGMYFVFPIFFVLLDPGFVASPSPPPPEPHPQPYCYATMSSTVTLLKSVEDAGIGNTASLAIGATRDNLAKSYITLIMHPLICLFLTMVFVRYMMTVLGGDTLALTKMISKVV